MSHPCEVLFELTISDLNNLRNIYKPNIPATSCVYNAISVAIEWKTKWPDKKYSSVYGVQGWEKHGTFIILFQVGCYDLFIYTLEDDCKQLTDALIKTKQIDWSRNILIHAVHEKHFDQIMKVFTDSKFTVECCLWWISKDDAKKITFECPPDISIRQLSPKDAETVNDVWPHKSPGSENFVRGLIELNGGLGIYMKSNNELAAWVLRNPLGILGILQTAEKHKRKGYGSLIMKAMAKQMAEDGFDSMGTVLTQNDASHDLCRKIGFTKLYNVIFIGVGEQKE